MMTRLTCAAVVVTLTCLLLAALWGERRAQAQDSPPRQDSIVSPLPESDPPRPLHSPEQLRHRVALSLAAWADWIHASCHLTDVQQQTLRKRLEEALPDVVRDYSSHVEAVDPGRAPQVDRSPVETLPILFTYHTKGTVSPRRVFQPENLRREFLLDLLTPEQTQRLADAQRERSEHQELAYREFLVARLDEELYFTREQREAIVARLPVLEHPYYSLAAASSHFGMPHVSYTEVFFGEIRRILSPDQSIRLEYFKPDPATQRVSIIKLEDPAARDQRIDEQAELERRFAQGAYGCLVAFHVAALNLSPEQEQRLQTSAKGAAVQIADQWKNDLRKLFSLNEARVAAMPGQASMSIARQDISRTRLNEHPLWKNVLAEVAGENANPAIQERTTWRRRAQAGAWLVAMDRELWLTPEQRHSLLPVVEQSLPENLKMGDRSATYQDFGWAVLPFGALTDEQFGSSLNARQAEIWGEQKRYFEKRSGLTTLPLADGKFGSLRFSN